MSSGKSIPVWYSEEDRSRVEEAAVLAGYKHLSKYIRDKSLDRGRYRGSGRDSMEAWAEQQEFTGRLAEIERSQKGAHALLVMLLFLVRKKATTGEFNELVHAFMKVIEPGDVLAVSMPELKALLTRFMEES